MDMEKSMLARFKPVSYSDAMLSDKNVLLLHPNHRDSRAGFENLCKELEENDISFKATKSHSLVELLATGKKIRFVSKPENTIGYDRSENLLVIL